MKIIFNFKGGGTFALKMKEGPQVGDLVNLKGAKGVTAEDVEEGDLTLLWKVTERRWEVADKSLHVFLDFQDNPE